MCIAISAQGRTSAFVSPARIPAILRTVSATARYTDVEPTPIHAPLATTQNARNATTHEADSVQFAVQTPSSLTATVSVNRTTVAWAITWTVSSATIVNVTLVALVTEENVRSVTNGLI
jgi:hypothetical protein